MKGDIIYTKKKKSPVSTELEFKLMKAQIQMWSLKKRQGKVLALCNANQSGDLVRNHAM